MKKVFNIKNDCTGMYNEEIIQSIFDSRGIIDIENFINPTADYILPYDSLQRIDDGAKIVFDGIANGSKFLVEYDVDLDGICSGTIIKRYLKNALGIECDWVINDGKQHGITHKVLNKINECKPDILIVVDSLDADVENYKIIQDMGVKIIVLDHHHVSEDVPYDDYVCLISSNRNYDNPNLSGAGVCWKFVKYLDEQLGTIEADNLIDLAMAGIIGDMSDMSEDSMENRAIAKLGIENIQNPALKKIAGGFGFDSKTVSFSVAPLVNASMRLNKNEEAVLAFLSDENKDVLKHIKELKKCKESQGELVAEMMPEILEQCESQIDNKMIVVIVDTNYGLSGLIGNQLLSIYQRPILILKENFGGYSGSARAIGINDDFREMCENTGLGEFAGHSSAFGVVNIPYNNFDRFREIIEEKLSKVEFSTTTDVDIKLDLSDLNQGLIEKIMMIDKISGTGFPSVAAEITIDDYEVDSMSGGKHLILRPSSNTMFIKWNYSGDWDEIEDAALCGDSITCVGTLQAGFLARKFALQLIISDFIIN